MSWIAIVVVVIGVYLAIKVVGFILKLAMWALALGGIYWMAAPYSGLPMPF